jgi:hypothetical protein
MIFDILLYIVGFLIRQIALILPSWQIWPENILNGLKYFCNVLAKINFIFPVDTLFTCLLLFINFLGIYYTAKLIFMIFNFFRGTGQGIDI